MWDAGTTEILALGAAVRHLQLSFRDPNGNLGTRASSMERLHPYRVDGLRVFEACVRLRPTPDIGCASGCCPLTLWPSSSCTPARSGCRSRSEASAWLGVTDPYGARFGRTLVCRYGDLGAVAQGWGCSLYALLEASARAMQGPQRGRGHPVRRRGQPLCCAGRHGHHRHGQQHASEHNYLRLTEPTVGT
jgi:hypothetical protein